MDINIYMREPSRMSFRVLTQDFNSEYQLRWGKDFKITLFKMHYEKENNWVWKLPCLLFRKKLFLYQSSKINCDAWEDRNNHTINCSKACSVLICTTYNCEHSVQGLTRPCVEMLSCKQMEPFFLHSLVAQATEVLVPH